MDDLGKRIRRQVQDAVREALDKGPTNIASAVSTGGGSSVNAVWSDNEKTVVQRNGRTTVIRHDETDGDEAATATEEDQPEPGQPSG